MAVFIPVAGPLEPITPANPRNGFTLIELYARLECRTIQVIPLFGQELLVFDEIGKYQAKPENPRATALARPAGIAPDDYIAGHAIVCNRTELK